MSKLWSSAFCIVLFYFSYLPRSFCGSLNFDFHIIEYFHLTFHIVEYLILFQIYFVNFVFYILEISKSCSLYCEKFHFSFHKELSRLQRSTALPLKHFFHRTQFFYKYVLLLSGTIILAFRFAGNSTKPSAICQNSSASMLATLAQYCIFGFSFIYC